ncbi:hypothetical protein EUGRSUZ_I00081 [Eucalyptus grandis]|uniref:Uncharacterized protein n=2 Tax=Eucalyptus grandis TaxID=71139 RepID=A0ACC3JB00_EUCGR|nr:hypothetical protein EUGRSUZ_I00081 [Eucalyptus grandis]
MGTTDVHITLTRHSHRIFFIPLWFCLFKCLIELGDRVLSHLLENCPEKTITRCTIFMIGTYSRSTFARHLKSTQGSPSL